jgi:hypothetical protein
MAQISAAGQAPIPPAKKDDTEDVAWALSTAEAMYARGDRFDALKWLRRAAESASEAQADDRALELAKAAADLATVVGPTPSMVPPPPPPRASQAPPAAAAPPTPSAPPPAPVPVIPAPPPTQPMLPKPSQPPPPVAAAPASPARPQAARPAGAPLPARGAVPAAAPTPKPLTRAGGVTPAAPRTAEGRRAARRSRPEIDFSRKAEESTQTMQDMALPLQQPRRRGRASRPAAEELTPLAPAVEPSPASRPMPIPATARTDDIDAWPTQTKLPPGDPDDTHDAPDEKTRIGVPAYEASAKMATEVQSTPSLGEDTPLRAAQAIRVVVWRTPEGVRVAPHGTHVNAITVDAVLVALDPSADLAAWLSGK